jgi:type I restriction enzyme, S subunit
LEKVQSIVPSKESEQQKIADCLTSLDDRITLETQKLAALKAHKKGLMQQLFPAAGQNLPQLRFPEFQDTGEWEEALLGNLSSLITSGSRGWAQFYSDTGSKFIRMTNLPKSGIQLILDDLRFVSLPSSDSEGSRTSLQSQDILISITAELGKIGIIPDDFDQAYINQHVALVRIDKKISCPTYLAYYISTEISNERLNRLNDSGTKAGLNLNTIRTFQVATPTICEQQKISDCLSSLDELITLQAQKIAALKLHKKGLMQQLFPSIEEVSG